MKNLLVFSILLLLATAPLKAQDSLATVHFYRLGKYEGLYVGYDVKHNSQVIGRIKLRNMFTYHCPPGLQTFSASTEDEASFKINIIAGETYYVECGIAAGVAGRPSFRLASSAQAKDEIAKFQSTPASVAGGNPSANGQDTLNFVYQKSRVPGNEGVQFTSPDHGVFISNQKKVLGYRLEMISLDTIQYEVHSKGFKRELFRGNDFITKLDLIVIPFGVQYEYKIDNTTYSLKKEKGDWACYVGEEKILSLDFYKKDKHQIVQVVMIKSTPNDKALKVATLYCASELIENKKTTFGKMWRSQALFNLIK
jgi:hypothetical protein